MIQIQKVYLYSDPSGTGISNLTSFGGEGIYFYNGGNYLEFSTNGNPRARVTNTGLEVGYTTTQGTYKLDVNGTARIASTLTLGGALSGTSATFSGQVDAASFYTSDTRYVSNQIQAGYNTNAEDLDLWVNYSGYQGGTTRFRDFRIGNGKNGQIAFFDGSTGAATFTANSTTVELNTSTRALKITGKDNYYPIECSGGTTTSQSYGPYFKAGTSASDQSLVIDNGAGTVNYFTIRGDGYAYFKGNVGIGTTSPANTLHISSTGGTLDTLTNVISRFNATTNTSGQGSGIALTAVATKETAVILSAEHTSGNNGDFVVKVYNGGATYPERMRITSGGDITTGGLTAGYLSAANRGNVTIYGSTDSIMSLRSGASGAAYFYHTGTHLEIYNTNSGYIKFATENAEVLRLTKEAWIYIQNRTAAPAANPVTGGYLYCESGALKYRGSSGTITTIANA